MLEAVVEVVVVEADVVGPYVDARLYEGRAYVIATDGREVRKSVYGKTWEEVHQKLTKMQADTMSGKRVASSTQTVAEYLDYWLEEHARHRGPRHDLC